MKKPRLINFSEIGAMPGACLFVSFLNARFVAFLAILSSRLDVPMEKVMDVASDVLNDAEIHQGNETW